MHSYAPKEALLTMFKKHNKVEMLKKIRTCIHMAKRAQQEGVTGEESIEQPAKGVHYTMGEAVEGSA